MSPGCKAIEPSSISDPQAVRFPKLDFFRREELDAISALLPQTR